MEHTNEFLRGMFAAYMGCEVEINNVAYGYKVIGVLQLDDNDNRLYISSINPNLICQRSEQIEHCKPILTPLSEVADEDAVEVANICNGNETEKHFMLDFSIVKKGYQIGAPQKGILFTREVIDYLRSPYRPNGTPKPVYDCGYMHIQSLIAADLAISSKQI